MKAIAYAILGLAYATLGFVQWFAEVDGLHEVLGWPSFFCWLVAGFTAFIPIIGAAAGIWGAHVAWGWGWLPALALFLGVPLFFLVVGGVAIAAAGLAETRRKARVPATSRESALVEAQALVSKYGAVLEHSKTLTRSEAVLPASKEQIKGALITLARQARNSGASAETIQSLRTGYGYLADFVSQRDAEAASSFDTLVAAAAAASTDQESLREHAAKIAASGEGAVDVKRRTTEEFARLIVEFDERLRE